MRHNRIVIAALFATCSAPAFAQLGGMLQGMLENAAKQAVQQGVEQGVQQGVTQAVVGAPAQPAAGIIMQNGCYYNLPAMPSGIQFNADMNNNGCVDQGELGTYMQVYQSALAGAAQQQAQPQQAPGVAAGLAGAVVGGALSGNKTGGLPGLTSKGNAFVATQSAIGAAAAARNQQVQSQQAPQLGTHGQAALVTADLNGDGMLSAEEIAAHQARMAASIGQVAPAAGAQAAVSDATTQAVGNAVGGALKSLFGR